MKLIILFLVMCSCPVFAQAIKIGSNFEKSRVVLVKKGWKPINFHEADGYEYIGVEKKLVAKGYVEVESCAVDKPYCIFNYKKQQTCLQLITFGEQIDEMKIYKINNNCSDGK